MADQNSLERCLKSLEKTLKSSRTGLPLLKQFIDEKYSGSEPGDLRLIVEFLETCQLILSDQLSHADKFTKAKKLAEEEENRVRHKISMNADQLRTMQTTDDIAKLEKTVKDVFEKNIAEGSLLHQVFVAFRDYALTQHSLCGQPKPEKKKKTSCDLS